MSLAASILIPTLNEEEYIEECLTSLIEGMKEPDRHEVLVIDGGSTDRTLAIIAEKFHDHANIKVLHNPKKIVSAALNLGVSRAKHDYIVWCGSHAVYAQGYVENSLRVHTQRHCGSSGGVITPKANTRFGKLIAACTTSAYSGGGAPYRHSTTMVEAQSVFGGCFTKEAFIRVGGLDDSWIRNQDLEFNSRVRKMIGPIIIDPSIKCEYYCRESLLDLSKQYFQYGYWRLKTTIRHPETFSIKLIAPILLVLTLLLTVVMTAFAGPVFLTPLFIYLAVCLLFSLAISSTYDASPVNILKMSSIFAVLHFSWGLGFLFSAIHASLTAIRTLRS